MRTAQRPPPAARLCVLASGSRANCSVLEINADGRRRVCLIDAGLSPGKTTKSLNEMGISASEITDVFVTHMDMDHFHPGWARQRRLPGVLRLHKRHVSRADRLGLLGQKTLPFEDGPVELGRPGELPFAIIEPVLLSHDSDGCAAFRFTFRGERSLGFATDLGRVTRRLTDHLAGVDVLAIESNYCPEMQRNSDRPEFLKRRIMGGSGHLSNQEAAKAVAQIRPREHVVFLHLSQQCNDPGAVASMHEGADYAFTIADQHDPTRWIGVGEHALADRLFP